MRIVVQTQPHIFSNHRKLEFDRPELLSIGLAILVKSWISEISDSISCPFSPSPINETELIEINPQLSPVNFSALIAIFWTLATMNRFHAPDSVIHLVAPLIKICLALHVVLIVGIRKCPSPPSVVILRNNSVEATSHGLRSPARWRSYTLLLHHGNKSWVTHQLHNDVCYSTDQWFFVVLPLEIAFVSVHHRAILATIVVKILGF